MLSEDEITEMLDVCKDMVVFMNERACSLNADDYEGAWKVMQRSYERLEREHTEALKALERINSIAAQTVDQIKH